MSLATRLGAFFLLALAMTLAGFSTTLFLLGRAYMLRHLDEHIVAALDALTASVPHGADAIDWTPGRRLPPIALSPGVERIFWGIYDREGRLAARSAKYPLIDPPKGWSLETHSGHSHVSVVGRDRQRFRLALRQLRIESRDGPRCARTLVTGASLIPMETSLRHLGLLLGLVSLGLGLLAAALGRRLCRRALAPVSCMAKTARLMTPSDRGQYLPSPGTRDELEDLASAFNGLLDRLREALERQRRFSGDASHQLRTPLAAMIGNIEVALRRERPAHEYRQILGEIHGDAVQLRQIVEALLFLSRAEAEAGRPACRRIDLAEWVPGQLARWSANGRWGDLGYELGPGAPFPVTVHLPLFGQLLDNLLENACKYSPAGSPIRVCVGRSDGLVLLAVEDRGPGVAPDDRARVFEPFYRSPEALRRGTPGAGLGLAVAQRIAHAFGGVISVDPEYTVGSRFVVRLPEAADPTLARAASVGAAMATALPIDARRLCDEPAPSPTVVADLEMRA